MLQNVLKKVFGTQNERDLKKLQPMVAAINDRESAIQALSDRDLQEQTAQLRVRAQDGESLDDLIVDAFPVVREAGWRVLKMRHFDVQGWCFIRARSLR